MPFLRPPPASPPEYNVALIGVGGIGLRSLMAQFLRDYFPLPGRSFHMFLRSYEGKTLIVDGQQQVIQVLNPSLRFARDDAERKLLRDHYITQSDGVVLMYSIDDRHSFEILLGYQQWILLARGADYVPMILAGNKCDLEEKRAVTRHEAEALAQHIGCRYMEISAKTNTNVDEMFHSLLREMRLHKRLFPMKPVRRLNLAYPPRQSTCAAM